MNARAESALATGRMIRRYLGDLPSFLRTTIPPSDWETHARRQIGAREDVFRRFLDLGVFRRPTSPYGRLMEHAGLTAEAVGRWIDRLGIEGALAELYGAGVYLSHAEFKGKELVRRGNLSFKIGPRDLDNPLSSDAFVGSTGGSRSPGNRVTIDLDMLTLEAPHHGLMLEVFGASGRPMALWRDVPPAVAGIKNVFRSAKIGSAPLAWFTPYPCSPRTSLRHYGTTAYARLVGRVVGNPLPKPKLVPFAGALEVAQWLGTQARLGAPGILDTTPSGAVRICAAAKEAGVHLDGTLFLVAGEPFTAGRAAILEAAGTRGASRYAMTEVGIVGTPCARQEAPDEAHVLLDKLAVLLRPAAVGAHTVDQVYLTTLHPASPKVLINAGSGDYAEISDRPCGCPLHGLGLTTIVRNVRSFEKLTSEGMTFEGDRILQIVDELLPARFGGQPTDYQFVEAEEADGLARVKLIISERVGRIDENAVVESVLDALGGGDAAKQLGAGTWRAGQTLRVVRGEPYVTSALKIQPLHVMKV